MGGQGALKTVLGGFEIPPRQGIVPEPDQRTVERRGWDGEGSGLARLLACTSDDR